MIKYNWVKVSLKEAVENIRVDREFTTEPPTSDTWGGIKKCNVPLIKECTIIGQREPRTDIYMLSNTTYNKITWSPEDGYKNDKGIMIDKKNNVIRRTRISDHRHGWNGQK